MNRRECLTATTGMILALASVSLAKPLKSSRVEIVASKFGSMSCAEAFATTYADVVGIDEFTCERLASGFGLGMGQKSTCGAVIMMVAFAGLNGHGSKSSQLLKSFSNEMGSITCSDFVDNFGYSKCKDCLRCGARLLEEILT